MPVLTTAGSIGTGQSDLVVNGRIATSASATVTVPLGIVPAGKTFFLTDVILSTVSTSEVDVTIQYTLGTVTVPIFRSAILSTSPCDSPGIESQPTAPAGATMSLLLPIVASAPSVDFVVGGFLQ